MLQTSSARGITSLRQHSVATTADILSQCIYTTDALLRFLIDLALQAKLARVMSATRSPASHITVLIHTSVVTLEEPCELEITFVAVRHEELCFQHTVV